MSCKLTGKTLPVGSFCIRLLLGLDRVSANQLKKRFGNQFCKCKIAIQPKFSVAIIKESVCLYKDAEPCSCDLKTNLMPTSSPVKRWLDSGQSSILQRVKWAGSLPITPPRALSVHRFPKVQ